MDIEILNICEKGATVSLSFSGTVWYVSLTLTDSDIHELFNILDQVHKQLHKILLKKEEEVKHKGEGLKQK